MKLAIISHTEHYTSSDGTIVGWGPTISELNHLAPHFEEIIHLAFLHSEVAPPSSLPYVANNIRFVPLPVQGGKTIGQKLTILTSMFKTIKIVRNVLKEVDAFQLRTPTGIGVYLIPYLTLFQKKTGWFKYAGNWKQEHPPLGYRLQRWMLKKQSRLVTINGAWDDQPSHCLTFENPCLTAEERNIGIEVIQQKAYQKPFSFLFVGRLEDEKGVQRILDAFAKWEEKDSYIEIHFVGNGPHRDRYEEFAKEHQIRAKFHGFMDRDTVFQLYRSCHFLLLPSKASEGFPKVIAEAMNFGCIPIVSTISSIGQYVNKANGFPLDTVDVEGLLQVLNSMETQDEVTLRHKALEGYKTANRFMFEYYNKRILTEILKLPSSE